MGIILEGFLSTLVTMISYRICKYVSCLKKSSPRDTSSALEFSRYGLIFMLKFLMIAFSKLFLCLRSSNIPIRLIRGVSLLHCDIVFQLKKFFSSFSKLRCCFLMNLLRFSVTKICKRGIMRRSSNFPVSKNNCIVTNGEKIYENKMRGNFSSISRR